MKLAIISDIHENFHNLVLFFEACEKEGVDEILCLGDLINTGIAKLLAQAPAPVYTIWGNNDGDKVHITKVSLSEGSRLKVGFDTYEILERDGRKLFLTHYPVLARPMARSGDFDAVFYGHDHKSHSEMIGNCLVLNPGEISAHKTGAASYGLYDTYSGTYGIYFLDDIMTLKSERVQKYRDSHNIVFGNRNTDQY